MARPRLGEEEQRTPALDDLRDGIHDRGPRLFLPTILGFFPAQRFANRRSMVFRLSSNLTDALSIHTRRRSDKLKLIHPNHLQPPFWLSFSNHNRLKQRSDWGGSLLLDHSPPKRVTFTLSKATGSEGQSHYVELSDDVSIPRYLGYLCLRCVNLTMPFERTLRDNEIKVVEERRYRLVSAKDLYNGAIHNYGRRDIAVVKIWHRAREEIMVFLGRFSQSWSDSLMSMGEPL